MRKISQERLDSFFKTVNKIIGIRLKHFEEHCTLINNIKGRIFRIKHKLREPSKGFYFVSAEKTANNFIVICRKFYIKILFKRDYKFTIIPTDQIF